MGNNINYQKSDIVSKDDNSYLDIENIFEIRKNIPSCIFDIYNNCKISLNLSNNYDISMIEKNLNRLIYVFKNILEIDDKSYNPLYTQFYGLFIKGKWNKLDNDLKSKNLEHTIDHKVQIDKYMEIINKVLIYLGKDINNMKEILNQYKRSKCKNYCNNNIFNNNI